MKKVELEEVRKAPLPELVQAAEDLVAAVKAGKVRGLFVVAITGQNEVLMNYNRGEASSAQIYMALHEAAHEILHSRETL